MRASAPPIERVLALVHSYILGHVIIQEATDDRGGKKQTTRPSHWQRAAEEVLQQPRGEGGVTTTTTSALISAHHHSHVTTQTPSPLQVPQLLIRHPELAEDAAWRRRSDVESHMRRVSHRGDGRQDQPTGQINRPVWTDQQPVGLRNLGNTCYLNAVVQCLYHTDKLTAFFLDGAWR